jgi:UDP-N-acetylmuramoyl-tripeptide--D-alanyl-D-alanine ligase
MTAFVAVTGSCGKTTTKNLIACVLGSRYQVSKSTGSNNCGSDVLDDLRKVRPDDAVFVQELGAWGAGTLDAGLALVQPRIGVITNFRNDHYSAFHGPRGAQAEKGKLVTGLPATGTAVLNWDDPLVRELASHTPAHVFSYGCGPDAELRAVDVTSRWPEPLTFRAIHRGTSVPVRTRLLGTHLVGSALAALAVGLVFGLPLQGAVAALESAPPTLRRMTSVRHPDGVTFIRDDFKAPVDSVPEVLAFLREASAARKLAVFGRISDYPGRSRRAYEAVARQASEVLDTVIFVGTRAVELWGSRRRASPYVFELVAQASGFLTGYLRAGDLVLLKGSGPTDHLERIMLSRQQPVSCWLPDCGLTTSCDACERLTG